MGSHFVLYSKKWMARDEYVHEALRNFGAKFSLQPKLVSNENTYPTCLGDPLNMSLILIPIYLARWKFAS